MLEARNIFKSYGDIHVLQDVSLKVDKAEIISIVGSSGAGKSTLLHILGTLDTADKGALFINNTQVNLLKNNALNKFRNEQIGFIFQFHHLLPEFTALENICIPALIKGEKENESKQKALKLLDMLHLTHRKDNKPSQLSGGEQQRVAVARALINNPAVVFADEPSGNLDSERAKELHDLFFLLRKELSQTFIIVTHNNEFADKADRKLVMKDGKIIS
jgi:lipoprotein-releasing system ATP-binding protein